MASRNSVNFGRTHIEFKEAFDKSFQDAKLVDPNLTKTQWSRMLVKVADIPIDLDRLKRRNTGF